MKFTSEVIALCKKLHELGVRKEIEYGDWFYLKLKSGEESCYVYTRLPIQDAFSGIPLWTWADAREWLREKKYFILYHGDEGKEADEVYVDIDNWDRTNRIKEGGKTDLEAILLCMIEIAEKGGKR